MISIGRKSTSPNVAFTLKNKQQRTEQLHHVSMSWYYDNLVSRYMGSHNYQSSDEN